MLCSFLFIDAEAKKKDEMIVNDNDLKECESVKNTIFVILSHWKIKYD